jgi:hypothetical protein
MVEADCNEKQLATESSISISAVTRLAAFGISRPQFAEMPHHTRWHTVIAASCAQELQVASTKWFETLRLHG